MRVNLTTSNIQARNQQNFGRVSYGGKTPSAVKEAIGEKFGKAAADALEALEKRHKNNRLADIWIGFQNNVLSCNAGLRGDNMTTPLATFPRIAITQEGVVNLLEGINHTLSDLTPKLGKKIAGLKREGSLLMYPAPLVAERLTKETVIPNWQGVYRLG